MDELSLEELRQLIEQSLPAYGYVPTPDIARRLARYLSLISAAQPRVRLVASTAPDVLVGRHLGESLALGSVDCHRLVDVGPGAGFPGLALALAWPNVTTTLVEAGQKKADFLRSAIRELGAEGQVEVLSQFLPRARGSALSPLATADLVTVRALERMELVPAWLGRWLDPGAEAAFWVSEETAAAWRQKYPRWHWGAWRLLPGARARGILRARWLGR
ncbi:MAG: 16S rRNA (guanine(527)-N(7))-methyltransferase RsmG [Terriglobales bacterium]